LTRLDAAYAHDDPAARAYTGLGHSDHVRTLGTAHAHDALAYSGAYDQTVRAWDTRVNGGDGATAVMQHAAPVQHLVVMRNDAMVAVASRCRAVVFLIVTTSFIEF
jgi:U3 small nucleolar RNA-associated protein 15